ncbi:shootin-1-like [Amphiura filiformis]|uniref:shootin-1-like n=1 Tax=Amphiura filiformis TaxID=82378 RepID=UPI003B215523
MGVEEEEDELSSGGEGSADSQEISELRTQCDDLREQLIATKRDLAIVAEERDEARADIESAHQQQQILAEQIVPDPHNDTSEAGPMQDAILELVKLRREHEITKAALAEREQTLAQFRRVSTLAYQELQEVQEKYAEETVLREKAEDFAAKMYQEKQAADAYKRQSLVLLDEAIGDDDKLIDALNQVEQLTKQLEEEKQRHKVEVDEVNSKLEEASSVEHLDSLETKLSIAKEENESLEQKVHELETKTKQLEFELEKSTRITRMTPVPPPPPPPPPPPAPPQRNPLEVLRRIIGNKKGHTSPDGKMKAADPNQKVYEATIDEMMKRIKSGKVQLKPVETQWKAEYADGNKEEKTLLNRGSRKQRLGSIKKTPAMTQLNGMVVSSNSIPDWLIS